jgi:hypothetical protein
VSVNDPPSVTVSMPKRTKLTYPIKFVIEAEGKIGIGESKQGPECGLAGNTDHGVHTAYLCVKAPDRLHMRILA